MHSFPLIFSILDIYKKGTNPLELLSDILELANIELFWANSLITLSVTVE